MNQDQLRKGSALWLIPVCFIFFSVLFYLLSWKVFSEDDSHLMRVALNFDWVQHYFIRDTYQQLSAANYTPIPLTVYKLLATAFPFSPAAFLVFMLTAATLFVWLAGVLVARITRNGHAAIFVVILLMANLSLLTLVSRFYTMHYLIGGLFTLATVLLIYERPQRIRQAILAGLLMFLALLSKEVYLVLPPLVLVYGILRKQYLLSAMSMLALICYLALRNYMLGQSFDVGAEDSYFAGFWNVAPAQWQQFLVWYLKTRLVLLFAVVMALLLNPLLLLRLLIIPLLFLAPALAVTHGITEPGMHGDRIFFAFDTALAIVTVIALSKSTYIRHMEKPALLLVFFLSVTIMQFYNSKKFRAETESGTDHLITSHIVATVETELPGKTLFVPFNFIQGDLMRVNALLSRPAFTITQNCEQALAAEPSALQAFDAAGSRISREQLAMSCQPVQTLDVEIMTGVNFRNGILSWELNVPSGMEAGVLFTDRAFAAPLPRFAQQLVRPAEGERYQFFARSGERWWFSAIRPIEIAQ